MKTHPLFFFAADDVPSGGTTPSAPVPAEASPTGSALPTATPATPAAEKVSLVPEQATPSKAISAKKALGLPESPRKVLESMQRSLKSKVDAIATPLPPRVEPKPVPAKPEPETPVATEEKPVEKPAEQKPAPKPAEPAKIKHGDKEYTQEELTKYLAELEAKLNKPAEQKPAETAQPAKPQATPEEAQKAAKEKDLAFVNEQAAKFKPEDYGITFGQDELDKVLAGGEDGLKLFTDTIARVAGASELNARKWTTEVLNGILAEIDPVIAQHRTVAAYQAEQSFFEQHQDLKPHIATVRAVSKALREKYPEQVAQMTQEAFDAEVADHVKAIAGQLSPQQQEQQPTQQQQPVTASVTPPQPKPQPKPPTGQVPGGAPALQKADFHKSVAMDLRDV